MRPCCVSYLLCVRGFVVSNMWLFMEVEDCHIGYLESGTNVSPAN